MSALRPAANARTQAPRGVSASKLIHLDDLTTWGDAFTATDACAVAVRHHPVKCGVYDGYGLRTVGIVARRVPAALRLWAALAKLCDVGEYRGA